MRAVTENQVFRFTRSRHGDGGVNFALMIRRIVSGGQTGADRAGLDAAISCGVPHGGWCPKGRRAENGVIPDIYQLAETEGSSYLSRTERNVKQSDGTVIFTLGNLIGGSCRTADFANRHHKPYIHIRLDAITDEDAATELLDFVVEHGIACANIAGSSESREQGIYERVLAVMTLVLALQK